MVIEQGEAICIMEPRGDNGLEGYLLDKIIRYQKVEYKNDKTYYRVWKEEWEKDNYYECCGPIIFKRYFLERRNCNGNKICM